MIGLILRAASDTGVILSHAEDGLIVDGPERAVDSIVGQIKPFKFEIIKMLNGETIDQVGSCDDCEAELTGFPTTDGFVNRTCLECGKWFRCLELGQSLSEFDEYNQLNAMVVFTTNASSIDQETELF